MALTDIDGGRLADNAFSLGKNLIINGAMQVAQRGTSVTAQNASNEDYSTVDRFGLQMDSSASGAVTFSQSTTVPSGNGFTNSVKMVVSTANASPSSGHVWRLYTKLEAKDIANSGWDYTSTSSYLTLSFWARSSLSGTYCVNLTAPDVATNWKYISEYTLTAGTWKKVTITVPGHASNVFNNDNGIGLEINWIFLAGSLQDDGTADSWLDQDDESTTNQVNWMATVSNEFYLTGVQLEVGSVATPFEHRSFGDELARCQRYYQKSYNYSNAPGTTTSENMTMVYGVTNGSNDIVWNQVATVSMRANATVTYYSQTGTLGSWGYARSGASGTATVNLYRNGENGWNNFMDLGTSWVPAAVEGHWVASAEL